MKKVANDTAPRHFRRGTFFHKGMGEKGPRIDSVCGKIEEIQLKGSQKGEGKSEKERPKRGYVTAPNTFQKKGRWEATLKKKREGGIEIHNTSLTKGVTWRKKVKRPPFCRKGTIERGYECKDGSFVFWGGGGGGEW